MASSDGVCLVPLPGMVPTARSSGTSNAKSADEAGSECCKENEQRRINAMKTPDKSSTAKHPPLYHLDLSTEVKGSRGSGTAKVKVTGPMSWLSPLKKFNKVAPSPVKKAATKWTDDIVVLPLHSVSDSAILSVDRRETDDGAAGGDTTHNVSPTGLVTSGDDDIEGLVEVLDITDHCYSTVDKKGVVCRSEGDPWVTPHTSSPAPPLPERNMSTCCHSNDASAEPAVSIMQLLSETGSSTDDSLYESLKEEEENGGYIVVPDASLSKDVGNVQLVSAKGSVNDTRPSVAGMTPLHYAAASSNVKLLQHILSAMPMIQDPVEKVLGTKNLRKREGIDVKDGEERTALLHAVHSNSIKCVRVLVEHGASINIERSDGSSCLHEAAYTGNIDMIALLLSLGADGMKEDNDGRLPLHWGTNNKDPECINMLLDKVPGLSPNIVDGAGMTPIMWAAYHGRPENINLLKQRGADTKMADRDGMRAVHWGVHRYHLGTLQCLLCHESSEYYDNKGRTAMHHAAEHGNARAVDVIKAIRPVSVNDQDSNGRTPLHWATVCEKPEVIRGLLAAGADTSITDINGYTALQYAIHHRLHYCALLLVQGENSDSFNVLSIGDGGAGSIGIRTLLQQEGKVLRKEIMSGELTDEHTHQLKSVCTGGWINKFTNDGRGPLHPRFFWVDPASLKIHWSQNLEARYITTKETKSDVLIGVRSSSSSSILQRKDFDPVRKHKFTFTIFTKTRVLDLVAFSSEDYKTWLNGLQLLLHLGHEGASSLVNHDKMMPCPDPIPVYPDHTAVFPNPMCNCD